MLTARATAQAVEGLLLTGLLSTMVIIFIPTIGIRISAMLEPLRAVLG